MTAADLTDANIKAATRLGAPFKVYAGEVSPFRIEVAKRIATRQAAAGQLGDESVSAALRAQVRTEVAREFFRNEHGRDPIDAREIAATIAKQSRPRTQTVAGYDLTFSPVKSVSTLWAVADPHVAAQIERAHQAAVQDALNFIERHALFTRQGRNGVRQVNVTGLVAAAFTHRDSRAGDPDLHTHVAVANKVQTLDGRWLSIDGRVLFKATVAASETYNTALEHHLHDRLGVRFADRPDTDPGKRPVREIVGVDPALNQRWSTRRVLIKDRQGELAARFQRDHGRPPTPVEALQLAQQATLETRDAKHEPRTLTEQRTTWHAQAAETLGGPDAVQAMISRTLNPISMTSPRVDAEWVTATAEKVLAAVEERRSTWQSWHVRAEAQRHVRAVQVPTDKVDQLVELLVDRGAANPIDLLDSAETTASASRRRCVGPTVRVSTRLPDPSCSPPPGSWPPSSDSSPPRAAPTAGSWTPALWSWRCWNQPPTGTPWMPGRPLWFVPCAPPGRGCSSRSRPPAPGKPPPCAPWLGRGATAAATWSGWPRRPPQRRSSATPPAHRPKRWPSSPGPSTTMTCPIGRNASAGPRW